MSKIIKYKNVIECFPVLQEEYREKGVDIPDVSIVEMDSYILEYEAENDYLNHIMNELSKLEISMCLDKKSIYLCIAWSKNTESGKIRDYYKLWKGLQQEYDMNDFELGYEYKIQIDGRLLYAGFAKLEYESLKKALEILYNYKYRFHGFIYITSDNTLLTENSTKDFIEAAAKERIKKIGYTIFDYPGLYREMAIKDSIMNFASDGEGISLYLAQRQS